MSLNGVNECEDAEMAECDGEKVVTMMDVLKEQEDFEDDANAVLGASDDKNCTYLKGYVKRQAIYACMTCCTDAKNDPNKWAGVCLACSLNCHENHELIELYTKRNFRCDCGNHKFNSHPCQFTPNKTDLNVENIYNQNFSGVYCICHRPYPDPESSMQGDMIQCIICEDWLHSDHLDAIVPSNEQYSEMICKACMDKNEFLHDYSDLAVNKVNMDVDILNTSSEPNTADSCNTITDIVDDIEIEQADNDIAANKTHNEYVNKEEIQNVIITDRTKVQDSTKDKKQSSDNALKDDVLSSELTEKNLTLNEGHMCESRIDNKIETVQKTDLQSEERETLAEFNDNSIKKQSLLEEGEVIKIDNVKTPDNRSQEQVEEDLLLAEPLDTDLDQKNDVSNIVPCNIISSDADKLIDGKKHEVSEIIISTSNSEDQVQKPKNGDELGKESIAEETNSTSTHEKTESIAASREIEIQVKQTEQLDIILTPDHPKNEQTKTACKQLDDIPTNEKLAKQDNVEQCCQEDKNVNGEKNVLINYNISDSEDLEKNNFIGDTMSKNNNNDSVKSDVQKIDTILNSKIGNNIPDETKETDVMKRKLSSDGEMENVNTKKTKLEDNKCVRPRGMKKKYHGATFWPSNFRHKLCTCNECICMYNDLSVLFLIDPDDTVTAYENLGKEKTEGKPASQYEKGMAALSSLGRVQQINALTEYTKLRDKLLDFLKTFKDKKVIVKEEDIKAFFAGMKPVREPDGVYFCR